MKACNDDTLHFFIDPVACIQYVQYTAYLHIKSYISVKSLNKNFIFDMKCHLVALVWLKKLNDVGHVLIHICTYMPTLTHVCISIINLY